jgi:hypothetical protein
MFSRDRDRAKALEALLERLRSSPDHEFAEQESISQEDRELQRLASLAVEVERQLDVPGPSAAFRRASKSRVVRAVRARLAQGEKPAAAWRHRMFLRPAYVLATLALAVALVTSGVGVAHAAESALPGDALYAVKQGIEKTRLFFTFSAQGDMQLLSEFASERMWEVERLITLGKGDLIGSTVLQYEHLLDDITALAPEVDVQHGPQALVQVEESLQHHIGVLQEVRQHVPDSAVSAIDNALQRSAHSQEVLEQLQSGGSPSDLAPGQLKKDQQPLDAEETLSPTEGEGPTGPQKTPGPPESPPGQDKDKHKDKNKDKDKGSGPPNSGHVPGEGLATGRPDGVGGDR